MRGRGCPEPSFHPRQEDIPGEFAETSLVIRNFGFGEPGPLPLLLSRTRRGTGVDMLGSDSTPASQLEEENVTPNAWIGLHCCQKKGTKAAGSMENSTVGQRRQGESLKNEPQMQSRWHICVCPP